MAVATDNKRRGRLLARALVFVFLAGCILLAGTTFFWFMAPATASVESVEPADAVVVFQGGGDRIDTAVELIENGAASRLVIPNGAEGELETDLCHEDIGIEVYCPSSDTIDTRGEAQAIGELARNQGWSRLIAVTVPYHVHRSTYLLSQCFTGSISAVTPDVDLGRREWLRQVAHEWLGTLAAMTVQRAC